MNEEQHYIITQIDDNTVNIKATDGYYITRDDIKIINEVAPTFDNQAFTIERNKDLSYTVRLLSASVQSVEISVTPHELHDEVDMPDVVKQKIMDEEYTIEVTCDLSDLQIHIDGQNYMQSCSLDIDRYIKDQGVIGGFIANEFEMKLMGFPNIDVTGQKLDVNATINYTIEGTDYTYNMKVGTFTISTCTYDDTSGVHTLKAYDNALLYNIDYVPSIEFPCTVIELVNDVLNQTKQTLANSVDRYISILPEGSEAGNYYFTVGTTNYGFNIEGTLPCTFSLMFDGTDLIIRTYLKTNYFDNVIYSHITTEVLNDTTGYTYLNFKKVQYTTFNNNLFVVDSNQFDVTTTTNQNDQSVEITHASCRSVIQDIAKTMYGWAYITADGELSFKNLKSALQDNYENSYTMGKTIQHKPLNPDEIISPVNPAEVEHLSWASISASYNNMCIPMDSEWIEDELDGLNIDIFRAGAIGILCSEESAISTNDEPATHYWDVNYLLPEQMFVKFDISDYHDPTKQHTGFTPSLKYIHNGEIIETTNYVTILEKNDRIIGVGYTIAPHVEITDEDYVAIQILFSTMEHFNDKLVAWDGEYSAYGLLSYIDDEHYDGLNYVLDKTNPYYGYVIITWGAHFVIGAQLQWDYDSTNELFYAALPTTMEFPGGAELPIYAEDGTSLICKYYQGNTPGSDDRYFMYISNNTLYVKNKDLTSMNDWNAWLYTVAQDFIVTYALNTPLVVPAYQFPVVYTNTLNENKGYYWKGILFSSLGSEYYYMKRKTNLNPIYDLIDTNHYKTSKQISETTKPINKVLVGLKDIEGENVYITSYNESELSDDVIIEDNILAIYNNNITYTPELRTEVLREGANELFDINYTPLEVDMPGIPWMINGEPYIFKNVDGDEFIGYAFKSHFEYKGFINQKISSESTTSVQNEYTYNDSYTSALNQTRYIVDKQNQQITSLIKSVKDNTENISEIKQTNIDWTARFESVGGGNYIKNSVGLGDATNLVWEFTGDSNTSSYTYGTTSDASLFTKSGSRWYLNGYKMTQSINVLQDGTYSFACKIKKPLDTTESCYIKIYDTTNPANMWEIIPDPAKEYNFQELRLTGDNSIQPQTTNITVEVYASEGCELVISDMMLNAGNMCSTWAPAASEILTTNVKMDAGGLRVLSTDYVNTGLGDYTIMTPSYFRGYGNNNGTEECVFQVSGTKTMIYDAQVKNSQVYGDADSSHYNVKVIPVTNSNYDGIAFIKSQGE